MKYKNLFLVAAMFLITACQNKPESTTIEMQPPPTPVQSNVSLDTITPSPTPVDRKVDDEKLYSFVSMENPPTYPGGLEAFYKFLGQNIKYPKLALENEVKGSVILSFVVAKDGSIEDVKVEKKLGSGTDEEAVRVLKMSERWNPGINEGKPVRVKYNIPVKFN